MKANLARIDRVNVHWMPYASGCHLSLFESDTCIGGVAIRADVPFGEQSSEGWRDKIAALEHGADISVDDARAVLPPSLSVTWDDTLYHSFDVVELRGQGGDLRFWITTAGPLEVKSLTDEQKAEVSDYLHTIRDLLWDPQR